MVYKNGDNVMICHDKSHEMIRRERTFITKEN